MTKDSTRKWLLALFFGLIIWSFFFFTRTYWYTPWCAVTPTPCLTDHVNAFDRIVFGFHSVQADFLSNIVQNFVGLFVFIAPWFLFTKKNAFSETLVIANASIWNLAILEITRAIVQRPRPLVFNSVLGDGANVNQYTSFYSGHTSFVALACLSFFFLLKRRFPQLSPTQQTRIIALYTVLGFLTGILRIMGGRHYPTDVMVGFLVGSMVAIFINRLRNANN